MGSQYRLPKRLSGQCVAVSQSRYRRQSIEKAAVSVQPNRRSRRIRRSPISKRSSATLEEDHTILVEANNSPCRRGRDHFARKQRSPGPPQSVRRSLPGLPSRAGISSCCSLTCILVRCSFPLAELPRTELADRDSAQFQPPRKAVSYRGGAGCSRSAGVSRPFCSEPLTIGSHAVDSPGDLAG